MKGFLPLPKKHQVPAIFNGNSKLTGKKALITKVSEVSVSKPDEFIVKAKLEGSGRLIQTRILGFKNCKEVASALSSSGYMFLL